MPIFIWVSKQTKPPELPNLLEKAALILRACIFRVFESSEAQECCLPISRAPLAPTNPHSPPPCQQFPQGEGWAKPKQHQGGRACPSRCLLCAPRRSAGCLCLQLVEPATVQRCDVASPCHQFCTPRSCTSVRAGTRRTNVLSIKLPTSDWCSEVFFFCQP